MLAYCPSNPGRLTTCQRHASGEQGPHLFLLLSSCAWGWGGWGGDGGGSATPQSQQHASGNKSGCLFLTVSVWGHNCTPPPLPPRLFPAALTFYSQASRSYLECVTRAILHHLPALEPPYPPRPPVKQAQG